MTYPPETLSARSNIFAKWYVVLFFVFVVIILITASYNLYETFRIKSQVPQDLQESQDILIVMNIICILLSVFLLVGYYFSADKGSCVPALKQNINVPPIMFAPNNIRPNSPFFGPYQINIRE